MLRRTPVGALLLLAMGIGCNTHPATQIIVHFHAATELRNAATSLHVVVVGPEGDVALDSEHPVTLDGTTLARVPLIPRNGDPSRVFRVAATLLEAPDTILGVVHAVASYTRDERRELHLWFDDACRDVDCGEGRTCARGVCLGACFDPSTEGEAVRSTPRCGECESCGEGVCQPIADNSSCGCPGSDFCASGSCVLGDRVTEVWASELHTCAITDGRALYCWGSNRVGQLGDGGPATRTPRLVGVGGAGTGTAGKDHTCVLVGDGSRVCWGWNGNGQIGTGTVDDGRLDPTPDPMPGTEYQTLASGWYHTCGLTSDGRILCWGGNRGLASGGDTESEPVPVPTPVDEETTYTNMSARGFHGCGVRRDSTIWCWGFNASGELGLGDTLDRADPVQSGCPADSECLSGWTSVAAGDFHTCAIRNGGELWCWGGGANGQLGNGTTDNSISLPTRVELGGWRSISGGGSHSCGIREDGTLWCWGQNSSGELGVGDIERRPVPTLVETGSAASWAKVSLGISHSCAIRADSTLWCWGTDADGQLGQGDDSTADPDAPVTTPRRVCFPPAGGG